MTAVLGCTFAATAAIVVTWFAVGRHYALAKDPSIDLGEQGGRHVSIMGSLSGFAVTGLALAEADADGRRHSAS
jgi:hypothetical protein